MPNSLYEFLRQFVSEARLARFNEVAHQRTRHLTVVLENIHHQHNASACLRTCDCFGIQDVHIIESTNQFLPNEEIALGSSQWLTIQRYRDDSQTEHAATEKCLSHLRNAGYRILATSPRQDSVPTTEVSIDRKTAIILGSEQMGVSDYAVSQADELVHIPMHGFSESFNISVSTALILQQFVSQLRKSNAPWQLAESECTELIEEWVRTTLGEKLDPLIRRYSQDHA